jgi:hypothetical protein
MTQAGGWRGENFSVKTDSSDQIAGSDEKKGLNAEYAEIGEERRKEKADPSRAKGARSG